MIQFPLELAQKVDRITNQTKLLGLNVSIEAARAGEFGKGFKVVSFEIGKLSDNSTQAFNEIKEKLHQISDAIGTIAEGIRQSTFIAQEQSLALQNMSECIYEIQSESNRLLLD